jgi:hypothetical protein
LFSSTAQTYHLNSVLLQNTDQLQQINDYANINTHDNKEGSNSLTTILRLHAAISDCVALCSMLLSDCLTPSVSPLLLMPTLGPVLPTETDQTT